MVTVNLQAQECPQRQTNMIALRSPGSLLRSFHITELLDPAMLVLYPPGVVGIFDPLQFCHLQVIRRPVFNVIFFDDALEHPNQPLALQVHDAAFFADANLTDGYQALTIWIDQAIFFQPGQPNPLKSADFLEIRQTGVPSIKGDTLGLEAAFVRRVQHLLKVVILGQAILGFVIEAIVARNMAVAIGPPQRHEIDALHDAVMFARPVAGDQLDLAGVRLIQSRVIKDEDAVKQIDLSFSLLPHGVRVRFKTMQQASEGVVCGRSILLGLHTSGFGAAARLGSRNQKVDIVVFIAFRRIHWSFLTHFRSTA